LQAAIIRNGVFTFGASALWALLPAVGRHEMGLDASGYGIVLGSLGLGAVISALFMPRVRRIITVDRLTAIATLVFAGAVLALAYLRFVPLLVVCLMAGGMAWLTMMSSLTTAATQASPAWVRARTLSVYLLVFQGTMAAGSFAWGALAEKLGSSSALWIAGLLLVGGLAATLRWPLHLAQKLDLSPSMHWTGPKVVITPDPEDGPVLITVEYRVPAEQAGDFIRAMDAMRIFRRREGMISWGFYRDLADPDRYLETFTAPSWAEHIRQHARVTVSDQATETFAFSFLKSGVEPVTEHLISARPYSRSTPAEPPYSELS
jgi:MFS family permease